MYFKISMKNVCNCIIMTLCGSIHRSRGGGGGGGGGGGAKKSVWVPSSNTVELEERIMICF